MSKETLLFEKKDDDEVRKNVEIKGTVEKKINNLHNVKWNKKFKIGNGDN